MRRNFKKRKEDFISLIVVGLFILGFFVLSDYTGYSVVNESDIEVFEQNQTDDFDFGVEAVFYGTSPPALGGGEPLAPANNTQYLDVNSVNFTFNASVGGVHNDSTLDDYAVGNWWFEKDSTDESGLGNDGTVTGATNTTGIVGYAYEFNGSGDYININDDPSFDISNDLSVFTWIKPDSLIIEPFIITKYLATDNNREWGLRQVSQKIAITFGDPADGTHEAVIQTDNNVVTSTSNWFHVGFTFSSGTAVIYVNGIAYAHSITVGDAVPATLYNGISDVTIGTHGGKSGWFDGKIDEVLIFNRSLSSGEISAIYNNSRDATMGNCSLLLNIADAGWQINDTVGGYATHNTSTKDDYAVGNWWFEKDSTDESGLGNTGTWGSADGDENTTGIVGYAYDFDGASDWINMSDDPSLDIVANRTISAWIKLNDLPVGANIKIVEKRFTSANTDEVPPSGYSFSVYIDSNSLFCSHIGVANIAADFTGLTTGKWFHVVCTNNNINGSLYLNGVLLNSSAQSTAKSNSQVLRIGGTRTNLPSGFFNGTIDEVLIFNRSLSSGEISEIYNETLTEGRNITITVDSFESADQNIDWKVQCYDDLHIPWNTSAFNLSLTFTDADPPIVNIWWPENNTNWTTQYINFTYNVTDASNIDTCQLFLKKAGVWTNNLTNSSITKDINQSLNITLEDNNFLWKVGCNDTSGNQGNSSSRNITIDTTAPNITFVDPTPSNNSNQSTTSIYINYSVSDILSDTYSFINYDSSLKGWWRFEKDSEDESGNSNDGTWGSADGDENVTGIVGYGYEFYIDDYIEVTDDASLSPEDGDFAIALWFKTSSTGWMDFIRNYGTGGNHLYSIYVWTDEKLAGIYRDGEGDDIKVDGQGPTVNDNQWHHVAWVRDGTTGYLYLDGSEIGSDTDSNLGTISVNSASDLQIGRYTDTDELNDQAYFNGTIDEVLIFNRSLSQEEITALYNGTQTYHNFTSQSEEDHTFNAYTVDYLGNKNQTGEYTVTVDTTAPITNLQFPFNNTNSSTKYINFTYNVSDNLIDIDSCILWLKKSGSWELNTTNWTVTETINQTFNLTVDDQNMLWRVECNDTLNNRGNSTTKNITIDATAPIVNSSFPFNNTNWSTPYINFTYNVTDVTSDVDTCILYLQNGTWYENSTNWTITETINQTFNLTLQEGYYGWKVGCNDTLGNVANSSTKNITIDLTAPVVNISFPFNNTNWSTPYINFTYNVTDLLLNVDTCNLWLQKSGSWELNSTNWTITETINQTFNLTIDDQNMLWLVECNDTLNNRGNSTTKNITIDATAPLINLQAPTNNSQLSTSSASFIYNVSDNVNIDNCSLYTKLSSASSYDVEDSDISITKAINQSINITFTSSKTIDWKIGCYNEFSRQGNSSARQVIIQLLVIGEEEEVVVAAGGGSSSGIGSSAERQESIITESVQTVSGNLYAINNLLPGETGLKIDDPNLAIIEIILDSAKEAENVEIKIDESKRTKLEEPDRRVYRYASIETNIPESFLNKVKIIFKVQKNWGENIKLLRYTYEWKELPTEKINDDKSYDYYEAESLGFSMFAISSEAEPSIVKKLEETFTGSIVRFKEPIKSVGYYWIIIIPGFLVLVLIIEFIIYRKSKHKPEHLKKIEKGIKKVKKEIKKAKIPERIKESVEKIREVGEEKIKPIFMPQTYMQQAPPILKEPKVNVQKIINEKILRFNKLLKYVSIDISMSKLDLANKRYKELLDIYKDLLKKVSRENKIKLYRNIEKVYEALRRALEINKRG